ARQREVDAPQGSAMNLSNDDVQDILHVLDSTSYDELKIETASFRLVLPRSPRGSWTQEAEVLPPQQRWEDADREVAKTMSGAAAPVSNEPSASGALAETAPGALRREGAVAR